MTRATAKAGRKKAGEPMNLRFPSALRRRVKKYARAHGLEEATAVRVLCAERLRDVELHEEREAAERWQFQQALADMDQLDRGEMKTVEFDELRKVFAEARKGQRR